MKLLVEFLELHSHCSGSMNFDEAMSFMSCTRSKAVGCMVVPVVMAKK
jgi:hypothetical protein